MTKSTFDELFLSDKDKSENGVERMIGVNAKDEDVVLIIAEAGSERHSKAQRKYSKQLELTRKRPKAREKVQAQIIAESILVGWRGVLDENKNEIEPTVENKIEFLMKYNKLFYAVLDVANDSENYRAISIDDDEEDTESIEIEDMVTPEEDTEKN